MTLEETRQNLLQTAQQDRPYVFLQAALPHLEQVPDDAELRLLALGQLAQLGLVGPALELLDGREGLGAQSPDLDRALTVLKSQPSGHISWSRLSPRFEANLEVALKRFEGCRRHEQEIRRSFTELDLFRCNDGDYQLSRRVGSGPRRWLPRLIDWRASAARAPLLPDTKDVLCPPYFLEGIAFGEVLRKIYGGTHRMYLDFSPRIHVLETNCAQFAVWLHVEDQRDILRDPRVHLWLGEDGAQGFTEFHRSAPNHAHPRAVIRVPGWGPAAQPLAPKVLNTLTHEIVTREQQLQQQIRDRLRHRSDFTWYAERFRAPQRTPLRILGVTSRHTTFLQYSMRDIAQSLTALGHEFQLVMEGDAFTPAPPRRQILAQIDALMPDLILMIDHNRHEFRGLYDFPIPYCNWIQDELPHLFGPNRGRALQAYDLVVGHINERSAADSGYPPGQCHHTPVPVNPRVFSSAPVSDAARETARCDLSFVSNLSMTGDRFLHEQVAQYPQPEIRKLLPALYDALEPRIAAGNVPATTAQTEGVIQQVATELGFHLPDEEAAKLRRNFVDRLINICFRHQPLHWAREMELDLHLYGRGWEQHPQLGRYAQGVAANGEHLRAVFQAARINLQLFPNAIVHQRLLEGVASGGFFLIRGTPYDAVHELFASVARRCVELGIRSETELWETSDPRLAADVRKLSDVIYAPKQLPAGTTIHLRDYVEFGHQLDMPSFLPRYHEVRFGTREEFERLVTRYLADADAPRQIAAEQRKCVLATFTYDAVVADILRFIAEYFAGRAASEDARRLSATAPSAPLPHAPAARTCS